MEYEMTERSVKMAVKLSAPALCTFGEDSHEYKFSVVVFDKLHVDGEEPIVTAIVFGHRLQRAIWPDWMCQIADEIGIDKA